MNLYIVSLRGRECYVGTMADARAAKQRMAREAGLPELSWEPVVTEVEVPTNKPALIVYLNKLLARQRAEIVKESF